MVVESAVPQNQAAKLKVQTTRNAPNTDNQNRR